MLKTFIFCLVFLAIEVEARIISGRTRHIQGTSLELDSPNFDVDSQANNVGGTSQQQNQPQIPVQQQRPPQSVPVLPTQQVQTLPQQQVQQQQQLQRPLQIMPQQAVSPQQMQQQQFPQQQLQQQQIQQQQKFQQSMQIMPQQAVSPQQMQQQQFPMQMQPVQNRAGNTTELTQVQVYSMPGQTSFILKPKGTEPSR